MSVPLLVSTVARAQPSTVQAEQLFREGKRLMAEGKIPEACRAFEGSFRKDEVVSTLLNLADCREKNGEYASAWGHFLDAQRMARGRTDLASFIAAAKQRAAALEAKLSYLIINVPAEANVEGLVITRNGDPVDEAEWNTDIPVDGGAYVVAGKAPGYEAWSTTITVGKERDKQSVNVPKFRARPKTADPGEPAVSVDGPVAAAAHDATAPRRSGRKRLGVVTAAGGGALVVGGLAVGYLAQQTWRDAKDRCGADLVCDSGADYEAGQDLVAAARLRGNVSTIVTGAGVAAIGVGVALWLTAPAAEARGTGRTVGVVGLTAGGVAVVGGLLLGYSARARWGEAEALCGTDHVCDGPDAFARGEALAASARSRGNLSTIVTGTGVAAIGVGAALLLTSRGGDARERAAARLHVAPSLTPDSVTLLVGGSL